jgi:NAD dependent epimerase/dehydratase family enzyme
MKKKTAILFGATGLIGGHVLKILQHDDRYSKIVVFTRSDPETKYDKAEYIKTGLDDLNKYEDRLTGDEVFCCLGTTMKKAGSKEQFSKVDLGYPLKIAE